MLNLLTYPVVAYQAMKKYCILIIPLSGVPPLQPFFLGNNGLVMIEFLKKGGLVIFYNFGVNIPVLSA
ncbi:MAG: hypothetical protein D3922_06835 [Candidatus Electrothrix sp. AR1]|nr:hypothetical protein [Candidatus Electrothrix sp. AR1]